jgi:serine/threonine-protein kinase RsbW
MTISPITIEVPSILENIRIVESFIENARAMYHIDEDIYGNILVAVTESVNNAIQHGNKYDKDKNVTISLWAEEDLLKFTVTDEGNGFDFSDLPDPTSPENLNKTSGRGIFLMKHLTDEVEYTDSGKTVSLTFYM